MPTEFTCTYCGRRADGRFLPTAEYPDIDDFRCWECVDSHRDFVTFATDPTVGYSDDDGNPIRGAYVDGSGLHAPDGDLIRGYVRSDFPESIDPDELGYTYTVDSLTIAPDELALVESLSAGLRVANSLPGRHPYGGDGGSYGAIETALIVTLAHAIDNAVHTKHAGAIARRLYDESINSGESIAYVIEFWNDGRIGLDS